MDLVAAVHGGRVRVTPDGKLPTVSARGGWAETAEVLATAGDPYGQIMAPAWRTEAEPVATVHLVAVGPGDGPWLDLAQLDRLAHRAEVRTALATGAAEYRGLLPRPAGRPPWFGPTWLAEVDSWIDARLVEVGLVRRGPSAVVKFWSLSVILTVPTTVGPVYFKAACDHFRAEPTITAAVARHFPAAVPDLIAIDATRGWMLMRAFSDVSEEPEPRLAPVAARIMASIQLVMSDHLDELAAAGTPDRTLGPTVAALQRVVEDSLELDQLDDSERRTAVAMLPWLTDQITALAEAGMPYSLGHGDLHLGNVAPAADGLVLFDWTDAAVTFPVLDVALLARSAGDEMAPAVRAAYAEVWREARDEAVVNAALALAPLVNTAYQAVSYEAVYRAQEPRTRWEMRGVVARSLRDLGQQWRDRHRG